MPCVEHGAIPLSADESMPVFRAIGMGIAIVILKLAMPDVLSGLEGTLVQFFDVAGHALTTIDSVISR